MNLIISFPLPSQLCRTSRLSVLWIPNFIAPIWFLIFFTLPLIPSFMSLQVLSSWSSFRLRVIAIFVLLGRSQTFGLWWKGSHEWPQRRAVDEELVAGIHFLQIEGWDCHFYRRPSWICFCLPVPWWDLHIELHLNSWFPFREIYYPGFCLHLLFSLLCGLFSRFELLVECSFVLDSLVQERRNLMLLNGLIKTLVISFELQVLLICV